MNRLVLSFLVLLASSTQLRAGVIAASAADFSTASNPNGQWGYGFSTSLGAFTPYTSTGNFGGNANLPGWFGILNPPFSEPWVIKNTSGSTQTVSGLQLGAGELAFHPGQTGQFSIVRWTAPTADTYTINGFFDARDRFNGTTVDIHVLENGSSLFNMNLSGVLGTQKPFSFVRSLNAGDRIDFVVGFGTDNSFFNDSTGLSATISTPDTVVPEPSSVALLGMGLLTICGYGWRRRRITPPR